MENSSVGFNITRIDLSNWFGYIGCGTAAILNNLIIIFVLIRNKPLLHKSAFIVALATGDLCSGIATLVTGIVRIRYTVAGVAKKQVHLFTCLKGHASLWLIGIQIPSVMVFLIGCERVVAVQYFYWYYKRWTNKMGWILSGIVYVYVGMSYCILWVINYNLPSTATTTIFCYATYVFGRGYGSYNYGFGIICGCTSVVTTVVALVNLTSKRKLFGRSPQNVNLQKFIGRQWRQTISMTCIAILDFILIVLPNIVLIISLYLDAFPPAIKYIGVWSADLACIKSSLSCIIYICFNRDFRVAFLKSVGIENLGNEPSSVEQNRYKLS